MKKNLIVTLAMFVLGSFGVVFGQVLDTAGHNVTVNIPNVAFLRFTPTAQSNGVYGGDLNLTFSPTPVEIEAGTSVNQSNTDATWGDLKVFINRAANWSVTVGVVQQSGPEQFLWESIGTGAFNIDGDSIATGTSRGWTSLGFGANDFILTPDDSMGPGVYVATVTYTLAIP
jgi:hypothetical protein